MFEGREQDRTPGQSYPLLPRDYHDLLEKKIIKVAVRDNINPMHFSSELRDRQKNAENLSLPDSLYASRIDDILDRDSVITYQLDAVSRLFSEKVRSLLQNVMERAFRKDPESAIGRLCNELYLKYEDVWDIRFNDILDSIINYGYGRETVLYNDMKILISKCYNNNVPETLQRNNQQFVLFQEPYLSEKREEFIVQLKADREEDDIFQLLENEQIQEYVSVSDQIPVRFDIEALAYLPSDQLSLIFEMSERQTFLNQVDRYVNQNSHDFNGLYTALERYTETVEKLVKDYYDYVYSSHQKILMKKARELASLAIKVSEHPLTTVLSYTLKTTASGMGLLPDLGVLENVKELFDVFIAPQLPNMTFFPEDDEFFKKLRDRSIITVG